jgi:hypothetical protein
MKRHLWTIGLLAMMGTSCAAALDVPVVAASAARPGAPLPDVRRVADRAEPLEMSVYPRVLWAQGDASVQLRIEPDPRSRSLHLEWWSDDGGGGSHLITLEGERAAMRHQFMIRRLAAGEYEVTAVLTRNDGTTVRRAVSVTVTGP